MARDRTVQQPGGVRLRLIQPGSGARAVTVLGRSYVPTWDGINGRFGYTVGNYERRMNEEAQFSVTFPNGPGTDGKMHRDRFLCLTDAQYRPGDEWFEAYRVSSAGAVGDLLYVGTPTSWRVDENTIQLTGFDGYWLLKKTRGTTTDLWSHAPRDVFEHYTSVWQAWKGDSFTTRPRFTFQTASLTTSDGLWTYSNVADDSSGQGAILIPGGPSGAGTVASLASADTSFGYGATSSESYTAWRLEVDLVISALAQVNTSSVTLQLGSGTPIALALLGDGTVQATDDLGTNSFQSKVPNVNGKHTFAIEGRGRWLYFYIDGKLMGDARPMRSGNLTGGITVSSTIAAGAGPTRIFVNQFAMRRTRPFLMRSSAVKGDYRIPGSPPPGGLAASYYSDADIAGNTSLLLAPTRAKNLSRLDPAIAFPPYKPQWPNVTTPAWAGAMTTNFSVRWAGAIWLDLDNHDYRLQSFADDAARVWVGKTRLGEQVINDWPGGHGMQYTTSVWLKAGNAGSAPSGNTGPLAGQKSGWYPIVVEYRQATGGGGCILEYQRDDQPNLWVIAGSGSYPHLVRGTSNLVAYWRMGEGHMTNSGALRDHGPTAAYAGTYGTRTFENNTSAQNAWGSNGYPSVIRNALATKFPAWTDGNGKASVAHNAAFGTAPWTVEAWAQGVGGISGQIIGKEGQWRLINLSTLWRFDYWQATVLKSATVQPVTSTNNFDHVVVTYDGTNVTIYVNGVAAGAAQNIGAIDAGTGAALVLGGSTGFPASASFGGQAAEVAFYSRVLSAAEITAHFNAGLLDATTDAGVRLSPLGTYTQAQPPRYDAHYDQIASLRDTFGFQYTCQPMQLESGEFPGRMVPLVRVGRDTDYILDDKEATAMTEEGDAAGVVDALLADAQGIADPNQGAQLTAEAFNWSTILSKLFVQQEYESLADITIIDTLRTRLLSLLTLRGSPWEQVGATPKGNKALADTFPLTGAPAEFAWLPGDGIRLKLKQITVDDQSARQINVVSRGFSPSSLDRPQVGFRQRPRGLRDVVTKIQRALMAATRTYQRQLVTVLGQSSGQNSAVVVSLPAAIEQVVKATLVVQHKSDASGWTITVNGVSTGISIGAATRYDITAFVAPYTVQSPASTWAMVADLINGTGNYNLQIELLVSM